MNKQETMMIMSVLQAAYPTFYRNVSQYDAEAAVNLWSKMFQDEPYELVDAAVMQHIATDKKGFPPHIGAIKDAVYKLSEPEGQMSEMEAWTLVSRALRNASMSPSSRIISGGILDPRTSAERNFESLPPLLQRIVGSPSQLAEWARQDESDVETVIQSNFMRSYRACAQREREYALMPSSIKDAVQQLIDKAEIKALAAPENSRGA